MCGVSVLLNILGAFEAGECISSFFWLLLTCNEATLRKERVGRVRSAHDQAHHVSLLPPYTPVGPTLLSPRPNLISIPSCAWSNRLGRSVQQVQETVLKHVPVCARLALDVGRPHLDRRISGHEETANLEAESVWYVCLDLMLFASILESGNCRW